MKIVKVIFNIENRNVNDFISAMSPHLEKGTVDVVEVVKKRIVTIYAVECKNLEGVIAMSKIAESKKIVYDYKGEELKQDIKDLKIKIAEEIQLMETYYGVEIEEFIINNTRNGSIVDHVAVEFEVKLK